MRRRRGPERSPGARLFAISLGGFAVAVGLIGFLFGGPRAGPAEDNSPPTMPERVLQGLEATQRAQRALDDQNVGEARRYLDKTQKALTAALANTEERDND